MSRTSDQVRLFLIMMAVFLYCFVITPFIPTT